MRILHYKPTMRAEEGGVVKAVFDMCALTAVGGVEIGLVTHDVELVRRTLDEVPATVRLHPMILPRSGRGYLLGPRELRRLAGIISEYDLVHLHSMWMTSNPQIARLCARAGKPYVLSPHGMLDDWCMAQRRLKKRVYLATWARRLIPDAARVHCTAQAELAQAEAWTGPGRGVVIPLPIDLAPYRDAPGPAPAFDAFPDLDRAVPIVLFLSRLHYKKGPDRLIRASAALHRRGVAHQLVLAGAGHPRYEASLRELAERCGVAGHTRFLGFVTGREKVALYQAATVFALPTSQENFGFVYFESLAAGTPVVMTRGVDTWPELLESGAGFLCENEPDAIAAELEHLLADPAALGRAGAGARERVLASCDRGRVAAAYHRMYGEVLAGAGGAGA